MLIEMNDHDYDRVAHVDRGNGNNSIYSLLSKDDGSNPDIIDHSGDKTKLGLLILEGEETYGDKPMGNGNDNDFTVELVNELSIPDTVLLPSDMRSVVTPGAASQQLSAGREEVGDEANDDNITDSYCRSSQFWRIVAVVMVFITAAMSFGRLRDNTWKQEALRLREEIQRQQQLLPLTVSLLMERQALLKQIDSLEKENHREKEWMSLYEDMLFTSNTIEDNDDPLLSIKNCYVEASLSLGHCSKQLQNRWLNPNSFTSGKANEGETYVDGFTADMAKLASGVKKGLAETTTQSYNFMEKVVTKFSYAGMKEAFLTDDYIQSIVKPGVSIVSALALGLVMKNALANDADEDTNTIMSSMEFTL